MTSRGSTSMPRPENSQNDGGKSGSRLPRRSEQSHARSRRAEQTPRRTGRREPIAILGMALRLPGGVTTPEQFWKVLADGEDLISTIPPDRWDADAFYSPNPDDAGTMYDIHGGFLRDVDAFDAAFFGINPREAARMDPQHRILLELTWEALERSAIDPHSLMDSQTGVWLGLSSNDYLRLVAERPRRIDGYTGIGVASSAAAGHIAHFLGTHGPAEVIDTACSSSLVALHHAVQSLRQKECDFAIVGAVNLMLSPEAHICFSRAGMLSRTGRCNTFDASADGYVRSEACCVLVLKRLKDAQRAHNRCLAVIRGSAVNHCGRSASLIAPSIRAQQSVMRSALDDAGVRPDEVGYVEAHGTGTPLGDPMEFLALGSVYGAGRAADCPLRIGSVKTNLGHTEAAAGLVGLAKTVLMMQPEGGIPPNLHFDRPNPRIRWQRWPITVPTTLTSWCDQKHRRLAAVSSFGFSGTNAHCILAASETRDSLNDDAQPEIAAESLLCLSADNSAALHELAARYVDFFRLTEAAFSTICDSAATTRAKLPCRLALRATTGFSAADLLEEWLSNRRVAGLMITNGSTLIGTGAGDSLETVAADFVAGGSLRYGQRTAAAARLALPLYPFQRRRFWFCEPPQGQIRRHREEVWRGIQTDAERQSRQGPLGWNPVDDARRHEILDQLTLAKARNVLADCGVFCDEASSSIEEVMQHCGFRSIYRRLVARWLRNLVEEGTLQVENGRYHAAVRWGRVDLNSHWQQAERCLLSEPGLLSYLQRCAALLPDVLCGRVSGLETLFPDGSFELAETLYENGPMARYVNSIVAVAVAAAVRKCASKRSARVLELGAGTGATTSALLPLLSAGAAEYWFTDVSDVFLHRARQRFGDYDFVHYGLLDLDRELSDQEWTFRHFDVIFAANVVHAARDINAALRRIHQLLAPGGALVLLETTIHQKWFDMSVGLMEGWQHFEDDERADHPLLGPVKWADLLRRNGFDELALLPGDPSLAASIGQHVLLARRDFASAERSSPESAGGRHKQGLEYATEQSEPQNPLVSRLPLLGLSSDDWQQQVPAIVRSTIHRVFRLDVPAEELGDRDRLGDLGMDSLMALELRGELGKALGLEGRIPSTIGFDSGTVGELTRSLMTMLRPAIGDGWEVKPAAPPRRAPITAQTLQEMTEEQAEELLRERLSRR